MNDQGTLRFDTFTVLDGYPAAGQRPQDVIARTLSEAQLAEQLEFDTFWLAEHHFMPYGICPSPPVLLSAIAQRTRRIRLGPAVCVVPLEHPIRVAEQYAMVDVISDGRLEMAVGAGYLKHEFAGFGVDAASRRERFDEGLDVLLALWSGQSVSHTGRWFQLDSMQLNVLPLQKPRPPVWVAVGHPQSVRPAARRGVPILLIPYAAGLTDAPLAELIEVYRSGFVANDTAGAAAVGAAYHLIVAPTDAEARELMQEALRTYIASRTQHVGLDATAIIAGGLAIAGDPDACIRRIRALEETGLDRLLLIASFGNLPLQIVERTLRLFAAEVRPAFGASTRLVASRSVP